MNGRVAVAALLFYQRLYLHLARIGCRLRTGGGRHSYKIVYKMMPDDPLHSRPDCPERENSGELAIFVKEWQQIHFI